MDMRYSSLGLWFWQIGASAGGSCRRDETNRSVSSPITLNPMVLGVEVEGNPSLHFTFLGSLEASSICI